MKKSRTKELVNRNVAQRYTKYKHTIKTTFTLTSPLHDLAYMIYTSHGQHISNNANNLFQIATMIIVPTFSTVHSPPRLALLTFGLQAVLNVATETLPPTSAGHLLTCTRHARGIRRKEGE